MKNFQIFNSNCENIPAPMAKAFYTIKTWLTALTLTLAWLNITHADGLSLWRPFCFNLPYSDPFIQNFDLERIFPQHHFYGLWSSQSHPADVGLNKRNAFIATLKGMIEKWPYYKRFYSKYENISIFAFSKVFAVFQNFSSWILCTVKNCEKRNRNKTHRQTKS